MRTTDERLTAALTLLMQPLRKHLGILDEPTLAKIYGVQDELLKLRGADADKFTSRKNHVFDTIEVARQFVKADKIALRLGLIQRALGKQESGR